MRTALLALSLLLATPALAASANKAASEGLRSHQNGDHLDALKKLDEALQREPELKPKNLPMAYYTRAMARMAALRRAASTRDMDRLAKLGDDPHLLSVADLESAARNDTGKWARRIEQALESLRPQLVQAALGYMQQAASPGGQPQADRMWRKAVLHLDALIKHWPDDPMNYVLRGQCRYELAGGVASATRDSVGPARADFVQATERFAAQPPSPPDLSIATSYYRLAVLDHYQREDAKTALSWAKKGQLVADAELERFRATLAADDPQWARIRGEHGRVIESLRAFELNIYAQSPELLEVALKEFALAVEEQPKNTSVWLAYANLLENVDEDAAIQAYQRAHALDPSSPAAFNLGALYNNRATRIALAANELDDFGAVEAKMTEADKEWGRAVAWLEKALEANPRELMIVQSLKGLYLRLERESEYARMKTLEKELRGG